jgi:hypothetical protein
MKAAGKKRRRRAGEADGSLEPTVNPSLNAQTRKAMRTHYAAKYRVGSRGR